MALSSIAKVGGKQLQQSWCGAAMLALVATSIPSALALEIPEFSCIVRILEPPTYHGWSVVRRYGQTLLLQGSQKGLGLGNVTLSVTASSDSDPKKLMNHLPGAGVLIDTQGGLFL